ncbi:MAG TPA: YggS family pyridoxal phosphate-dependent enzyme [Puia sp.]
MSFSSYTELMEKLNPMGIRLLVVSKTKTVEEIRALYDLGQRDFGENYVQELVEKQKKLPADIRWHFIGHLQSNKVKNIAPFIHMIQSVDSMKLLLEIDKQAEKNQRRVNCLLQIHIAREETKFGLDEEELQMFLGSLNALRESGKAGRIRIAGCMGMASLTDNKDVIYEEFTRLRSIFEMIKKTLPADQVNTLSMGMSSDYEIAAACGSTMVRIGSLLFGPRTSINK